MVLHLWNCLRLRSNRDSSVAATLYGGFVGTYLNELDPEDMARKEIPLSEVLPEPAGGVDTGLKPPVPPFHIGHYKQFKWSKEIKCIAIIPDFEVKTGTARSVLPDSYLRADVVFNMQRIALLATALGDSPPDPDMIFEGMQDKVHQPYRKSLVPGLSEILSTVSPKTHPGLLGLCLSGAGPTSKSFSRYCRFLKAYQSAANIVLTVLALASDNFESIAHHLVSILQTKEVSCQWKLLAPADGLTVART